MNRNPDGTCWDCSNPGVWSCAPPCACSCHVERSGRFVAAAPLTEVVRKRAREDTIKALADVIAQRLGHNPRNVERQLSRLLAGETTRMQLATADELAIGLGYHPIEVWGEAWGAA